ncbi:unnamed protein product [Timema podura]|uniref:Uncharacterized protein n=1 Tax=Timema podura TaxID=61482 RepID=A0ABN7PFH2_TIMPD|nr:unnamed protein product [Timema podura]
MSSSTRYSTALAHLFSAGASVWAFRALRNNPYYRSTWAYGTLGLFFVNSTVGVLRYGISNPEYGDKVAKVSRKTLLVGLVCGLPCIAAELYLYYGYRRDVAFAHLGSTLIPVAVQLLMGSNSARNSVDWVTAGNLLSIFVVTFLESNYYGLAMTACYTVNYFLITTVGYLFEHVPALDLFQYGLCFFHYFIVKSLDN